MISVPSSGKGDMKPAALLLKQGKVKTESILNFFSSSSEDKHKYLTNSKQ